MLVKATGTRELRSYSLSNLLLSNAGNVIHSVYVFHLPLGPIWVLHTFYLLTTALMLVWYLRWAACRLCAALRPPQHRQVHRADLDKEPPLGRWAGSVDRRQDREIPAVTTRMHPPTPCAAPLKPRLRRSAGPSVAKFCAALPRWRPEVGEEFLHALVDLIAEDPHRVQVVTGKPSCQCCWRVVGPARVGPVACRLIVITSRRWSAARW
jgi:hypothetical protein